MSHLSALKLLKSPLIKHPNIGYRVEAHLESSQITKIEFYVKIVNGRKLFSEKAHLMCLNGFWIRFCRVL